MGEAEARVQIHTQEEYSLFIKLLTFFTGMYLRSLSAITMLLLSLAGTCVKAKPCDLFRDVTTETGPAKIKLNGARLPRVWYTIKEEGVVDKNFAANCEENAVSHLKTGFNPPTLKYEKVLPGSVDWNILRTACEFAKTRS